MFPSDKIALERLKKVKMQCSTTDFPFFVHHELNISVFLQRVFHSIRFKVIKVGATAVALFRLYSLLLLLLVRIFPFSNMFFEENCKKVLEKFGRTEK